MADKSRINALMEKAMNPVADDGAQTSRKPAPKRDPSGNLGKFLHPAKSPKSLVNDGSKDANAAGSKVRQGF